MWDGLEPDKMRDNSYLGAGSSNRDIKKDEKTAGGESKSNHRFSYLSDPVFCDNKMCAFSTGIGGKDDGRL